MVDPRSPSEDGAGDATAADETVAWLQDELSLVVRDRRRLEDELDRVTEELASTRKTLDALQRRRSVRLALAASGALRGAPPGKRAEPAQGAGQRATTGIPAAGSLPPDAFRTSLRARLADGGDLAVARVERGELSAGDRDPALSSADVVAVSSPVFDVRSARGQAVTVALVGPDVEAWLDLPWLDDFDVVVTANPASVDAIRAKRAKVPTLVSDVAADLRPTVAAWLAAPRFGVAVGIPNWDEAPAWGDYHFARAVQRQLERRGIPTRVHLRPQWADPVSARDDVSLHLFGLSGRASLPGQLTLLWVISHPERVSDAITAGADRVFVASETFARELARRIAAPVVHLPQATDPERFHPDPSGPHHDVLFVGNSRGVRRDILADLTPTTLDLAVYGRWRADRLDPGYVRGELIPNEELHRYYSSAGVVLNDHWPEMRVHGFLSNRLYDALASGACVVSDTVPGLEEAFDGGIATYEEPGELRRLVHDLLADPGRRRSMADRGRSAVLDRHTFAHRADVILSHVPAAAAPRQGP